ncbi:MAG: mannan endo-1 [Trebouxia sp. A1-2]|nr:MAG: mannan endo-1 [Trebouxia sp. A1-2]
MECPAPAGGFVQLSPDRRRFELDGSPFFFTGCNSYYLMTRAADPGLQQQVLEVLDDAKAAGLTVIRTWAFNDGPEWNALQPAPGQFEERVFVGLDFVLAEAARRGLKVLLALTNYWTPFGGMTQYVKWSCERRGVPITDKAQAFYADRHCQDIFKNFLVTITSRTNTFTGVPYRDDPTILGWSLANEPRCEGDYSGSSLQDWIDSTAEFLKSLDSNHLITVGSEDLLPDNPYDTMNQGCDFLRNHQSPSIDFATIHLWPDSWLTNVDDERRVQFARRWINCHVDVCTQLLRKPLVLAEFGWKLDGRAAYYDKVFEQVVSHAKAGHAVTGSCFWMTASSAYPDYDGMTVYFRPPTPEVESQNAELMVKNAQPDQQQCAADSLQPSLGDLQSKLQGQISSLLDHARHNNKSVVEVIRHNAKTMHELNKQGKECKVM